jgi:hypothetical protein
MKFVERHPFAGPDAAARKIVEIANGVEAAQDGRIFIERVNESFLAGWRLRRPRAPDHEGRTGATAIRGSSRPP